MSNKLFVLALSTAVIGGTSAIVWHNYNEPPEKTVIRKLRYVEPKREPLKSRLTATCPKNKIDTIKLYNDNDKIWKKSHDEFFQLPGVIKINERRFKGREDVLPASAILIDNTDTQIVEFITCSGKPTTLTVDEIRLLDTYFIGQNNKGWIKLMKKDKKGRYRTISKAVTDIHLR